MELAVRDLCLQSNASSNQKCLVIIFEWTTWWLVSKGENTQVAVWVAVGRREGALEVRIWRSPNNFKPTASSSPSLDYSNDCPLVRPPVPRFEGREWGPLHHHEHHERIGESKLQKVKPWARSVDQELSPSDQRHLRLQVSVLDWTLICLSQYEQRKHTLDTAVVQSQFYPEPRQQLLWVFWNQKEGNYWAGRSVGKDYQYHWIQTIPAWTFW